VNRSIAEVALGLYALEYGIVQSRIVVVALVPYAREYVFVNLSWG
jgi:hypothetical protein